MKKDIGERFKNNRSILKKHKYSDLCPNLYIEDFDDLLFFKIAERLQLSQKLKYHPSEQFVNCNEMIDWINMIMEKEKINCVEYLKERLIEKLKG